MMNIPHEKFYPHTQTVTGVGHPACGGQQVTGLGNNNNSKNLSMINIWHAKYVLSIAASAGCS